MDTALVTMNEKSSVGIVIYIASLKISPGQILGVQEV